MNPSCLSLFPRSVGVGLAGVGLCTSFNYLNEVCFRSETSGNPRAGGDSRAMRAPGHSLLSGKDVGPQGVQCSTPNAHAALSPFKQIAFIEGANCIGVLKDAQKIIQEQGGGKRLCVDKLRGDIRKDYVCQMQNAFRRGLTREEASHQSFGLLQQVYADRRKTVGWSHAKLLGELKVVDQQFPYFTVAAQGGRLPKASDDDSGELLEMRHTLIRDEAGHCHTLLTTVYPDEARALQQAGHGVGIGKVALGHGAFGVVRLAQDDGRHYEAVKKMVHRLDDQEPRHEIAMLKKIQQGEHLIRYHGSAQIPLGGNHVKSYIFMDLAGQVDGVDAVAIRAERAQSPDFNLPVYLHDIGQQYVQAVAELHAQGIFHCDLKPENFSHDLTGPRELVKLIDYGAATDQEFQVVATGTQGFIAPEMRPWFYGATETGNSNPDDAPEQPHVKHENSVSNAKRDAWALGMALLCWRMGEDPELSLNPVLAVQDRVTGEGITLPLRFENRECLGFAGTDRYPGRSWDEVIAKLLDVDPNNRPTPAQVLKLPLFEKQKLEKQKLEKQEFEK